MFSPDNIHATFNHIAMSGNEWESVYLLARAPLQAMIVAWIYWFVVKNLAIDSSRRFLAAHGNAGISCLLAAN